MAFPARSATSLARYDSDQLSPALQLSELQLRRAWIHRKDGWCWNRPGAFLQVSPQDRGKSRCRRDPRQDKKVASQNSPTALGLGPGYLQNPRLLASCVREILLLSSEYVRLQAPRICGAHSQRKLDHKGPESISVASGHLRHQISPAKSTPLVAKPLCFLFACLLRVRPCSQSTPSVTR